MVQVEFGACYISLTPLQQHVNMFLGSAIRLCFFNGSWTLPDVTECSSQVFENTRIMVSFFIVKQHVHENLLNLDSQGPGL